MVCTENLCRSPMAEALLRQRLAECGLQRQVRVESAGTRVSRPGARADQRAQKIAAAHGLDLRRCRARRVNAADFEKFDLILAMDRGHLQSLDEQCPERYRDRLQLVLDLLPDTELAEVPDPYYGSLDGFRRVHELLDEATRCWAEQLMHSAGER